jgi:2-polyprenyl-3-methyl-5-hydroxy-6-metoxy-1,4-benzoquinol methylase
MISVLHHIKNKKKFINNLCKITKRIYIKDNNITSNSTFNIIKLQHEVYEGILYPNKSSNLYKLSKDYIIKLLKENNFHIKYLTEYEYFTKSFVILACKNI